MMSKIPIIFSTLTVLAQLGEMEHFRLYGHVMADIRELMIFIQEVFPFAIYYTVTTITRADGFHR